MRGLRLLGAGVLLAFVVVAFTPLANRLGAGDAPAPLAAADAVVALGAGVRPDGSLSDASLRRFVHGLRLYRGGLAPLLVFTGGPGAEAETRAALARELGVPAAAVVAVAVARTTREEALRAREDLAGRGVRRILLVTGGGHMERAAAVFARVGFVVEPAPIAEAVAAPGERLDRVRELLQEVVARAYYRLAGWM
jgi:uncharacterized SAM-binding protein YcdF (DUF218 family)